MAEEYISRHTGEEIDEAIDRVENKLDKITETTDQSQVYGKVANGDQIMYDVTSSALKDTIAYRHEDGRLTVGNPTDDTDAATKKYVDEHSGGGGGGGTETVVINVTKHAEFFEFDGPDMSIEQLKQAANAYISGKSVRIDFMTYKYNVIGVQYSDEDHLQIMFIGPNGTFNYSYWNARRQFEVAGFYGDESISPDE